MSITALLLDYIGTIRKRFYAAEYRDLVKEVTLLGWAPDQQLTWIERLAATWVSSPPPEPDRVVE